ncbi:keratinocyte-associated protein 2-like [Hydractinia symbiolongicarpus]|uniref:keratinocyte-associated protein 2-like n=1 Tax=Hydractinia symbiolongicarpus TaxID=13093 RepID=UPI002550E977|nr:keratinocyte-associated protein 2-like [Hydractinia symbiolongicarpus]
MALPTSVSCAVSAILCLITFAGMQLFKSQLGSSKFMTILGGFVGSQVFLFSLTALNNFETLNFGKNFQAKLFPEVLICLLLAMTASGMVHRVCVTTCFIFSCIALYYINKLAASKHSVPTPTASTRSGKGKKNN